MATNKQRTTKKSSLTYDALTQEPKAKKNTVSPNAAYTQNPYNQTPQQTQQRNWLKIALISIAVLFGIFIIAPILFFMLLGFLVALSGGDSTTVSSGTGNVAFIQINGMILTQAQANLFGTTRDTSSTELVKRLEQIRDDASIKGIIFEINSPGGSGVASDEIAQAIAQVEKPTVSYIREVGASGAYWIAASTDKIYVNRLSTVGSIGVIASYLDFSQFLERYNVTYQRFVAGENKDFGSPFAEVTPEQRAHFESLLTELHEIFIQEVADGRNMSVAQIRPYADGSIFTGNRAVQIGLADDIGGKNEAMEHMQEVLDQQVRLVTYTKRQSFFDVLLGVTNQGAYAIGLGIGDSVVRTNKAVSSLNILT